MSIQSPTGPVHPFRPTDTITGTRIDPALFEQLVVTFHQDLRRVARRERFRIGAGHTLCTTAVINEAWLKLRNATGWGDSQHFIRMAAMAMRQVLVNDARARSTLKRKQGQDGRALHDLPESDEPSAGEDEIDLVALDDALMRLEQLSARQAQVVECRYFAGFSDAETAQALGVTERTVRRDWIKARAWLHLQLATERPADSTS